MKLFRKPRTEDAPERASAAAPGSNIDELVPASAKSPDKQRLTLYDLEPPEEGTDDDLDFLQELAQQVERAPSISARPAPAVNAYAPDDLDVFRELALDRERTSVASTIKVAHVDMDDLLEDLATTAAALRQRKAA